MLDLARVKAWSFARPVIKNNRMAFTDCGAAYLRHGRIIHLTRFPDWSAMGEGGSRDSLQRVPLVGKVLNNS